MKRSLFLAVFSLTTCLALPACAQSLPACEWCGADEAPAELDAVMRIGDADEPGERLRLTGRLVTTAGEPMPGVTLYAYHTDATGIYRKDGGETGNGQRHGALRGWLRTGDDGRFEIRTIKPEAYPSRREAAHIHVTIKAPGAPEIPLYSILFEGDPLISDADRRDRADRLPADASHIAELDEDASGVLRAEVTLVAVNELGG